MNTHRITLRVIAALLFISGLLLCWIGYSAFAAGVGEVGGEGVYIAMRLFIGGPILSLIGLILLLTTIPGKTYLAGAVGIKNAFSIPRFILDIRGKTNDDGQKSSSRELWLFTLFIFIIQLLGLYDIHRSSDYFFENFIVTIISIPLLLVTNFSDGWVVPVLFLYTVFIHLEGRLVQKKLPQFRNYTYLYILMITLNSVAFIVFGWLILLLVS